MTKINKTHVLAFTAAIALALGLTTTSFAQTFYYVASNGELESVEASNASDAIMSAKDRMVHSGVISAAGLANITSDAAVIVTANDEQTAGMTSYWYVTSSDALATVTANSAEQAMNIAPNIKYNSGVLIMK